MTERADYLEHVGLVTDTRNGHITISLVGSGCSACHKSLCMLGDSKAKEVIIPSNTNELRAGDEVIVKINPASGYKAVTLLYLIPFTLMMLSLVFMSRFGEGMAGLSALLILVPYFSFLYLIRANVSRQCKIDVEKR